MDNRPACGALDRQIVKTWENGRTITRAEWEAEYRGFLDDYLETMIMDPHGIDYGLIEWACIPYWTPRELLEADRDEREAYRRALVERGDAEGLRTQAEGLDCAIGSFLHQGEIPSRHMSPCGPYPYQGAI